MLTVPNLPTDNLYKFLFIGGLSLVLSSVFLFYTQYAKIDGQKNELTVELQTTEKEAVFIIEDLKEVNSKLEKVIKALSKWDRGKVPPLDEQMDELYNQSARKDYRDQLEFFFRNKEEVVPYYREQKELDEKQEEIKKKDREHTLKMIQIKHKEELLKIKQVEYFVLLTISIGLFLCGVILAVYGYRKWYHLVQKPLDEKLKRELNDLLNS